MLNAGYLDGLSTDRLNLIQKKLTAKVANHDKPLFELPYTDDSIAISHVEAFYQRLVAEHILYIAVYNDTVRLLNHSDRIAPAFKESTTKEFDSSRIACGTKW